LCCEGLLWPGILAFKVNDMQEQKMVERKKDEKLGQESGMKDVDEPELGKASRGSNLGQTDRPGSTDSDTDKDKQFSQKESETATGRRGETGSEKSFQGQDNPALKKDVNKDWSSEQRTGSSPNTGARKDEGMTSEKDADEQKKASEKEDLKRKNQQ
jgi:hypothetical protein